MIDERLPGITETAKIFAGVDVTKAADPGAADRALQHGRHSDELPRRGRHEERARRPDTIVPGLMAVGEAACVSVHGANRLGSNSLLDLVVFGRAAAHRCGAAASSAARGRKRIRAGCGRRGRRAPRQAPQREGQDAAPPKIRLEMQRVMQNHAAVFRTGDSLQEGIDKLEHVFASFADVGVSDRTSDLEHRSRRDARARQPAAARRWRTIKSARESQGEPRRAGARGLPGARRRELDEAHAVLGRCARPGRASTIGPSR